MLTTLDTTLLTNTYLSTVPYLVELAKVADEDGSAVNVTGARVIGVAKLAAAAA